MGRIALRKKMGIIPIDFPIFQMVETHPSAALREPRAIKSRTIVKDGSGSATHGRVRDDLSV